VIPVPRKVWLHTSVVKPAMTFELVYGAVMMIEKLLLQQAWWRRWVESTVAAYLSGAQAPA